MLLALILRFAGRFGTAEPSPFPFHASRITHHVSRLTPPPSIIHHPPSTPSALRLSNTSEPLGKLARSDKAILLENAVLDTALPLSLPIPDALRAHGEPGAYIVQSRGPPDGAFRSVLKATGAELGAYIPNNAYLVRASATAAAQLAIDPRVQAVLPFEPYFKLKPSLLELALAQPALQGPPLPLNLLLFPGARQSTLDAVRNLGLEILSEHSSPFGPLVNVRAPSGTLLPLAALPGVQELELSRPRVSANDLSRSAVGVAANSVISSNYLGLAGSNILVSVNDTGVDTNQPDLLGRVLVDVPASGTDTNGHGTHVAGIIAGSGLQSTNVTSAPGSVSPPVGLQFRGKAPAAKLFSVSVNLSSGSAAGDAYLQQTAALTNALISNNSWLYAGDNEYDLAAAGYDAAVRDALPGTTGSQPVLFVFPAGNSGRGHDDGTGGTAGTILSPGTAKNVITVGALELPRFLTNHTWTCAGTCQTNTPWLAATDSTNQVAAFSSRGNVGRGLEGEFGRFKPDLVAPGTFIISTRSAQWDQAACYAQSNNLFTASPDTNYSVVLSNLNANLGPFYRFESGTSLAAADVAGTLALMQEFFEQRLGRTNSPALMKALLINGARSLGAPYDLRVGSATNAQGWGLPQLPNSLPVALTNPGAQASSMFLFDQNPANALATGQSQTRFLAVSPAARSLPLRLTLVWTDPPGNPVAGLKLVNDLDLLVTNLDTGEVFLGNDIPAGSVFNQPWDTNAPPDPDYVNNVENIYLAPGLTTNYSVTILARRVAVNAVTAQASNVAQDYALVISSGDGQFTNALTLTNSPIVSTTQPVVTFLTNTFTATPNQFGALLLQQRVGADNPLPGTNTVLLTNSANAWLDLGSTNQWHFYVLTNNTAFTNAAFLTFLPPTLSLPPSSITTAANPTNAARLEADVDLYVSRAPGLTNLDPTVLSAADFSVSRGGTEMLLYSNATPGPYYIGVKCESHQGAEYGFLALFSEQPFVQTDAQGNQLLSGVPAPALIPGGTATLPAAAYIFGLAPESATVRRVIVTNTLTRPAMGDLLGTLTHRNTAVVLNNHATNGAVAGQAFVYDDSGEGDVSGAQPPDGPGRLSDFDGRQARGQWMLTMLSTNLPGTNDNLSLFLERQPDLSAGSVATVLPGACSHQFTLLPPETTNLLATVSLVSGDGPLSLQIYPVDGPASSAPTFLLSPAASNVVLTLDQTSHPPLNPGLYAIKLCNLGSLPATVDLLAQPGLGPSPPLPLRFTSTAPVSLLDDAVSTSTLTVTNQATVLSAEVGVRIDHPRVSDLVLNLVSPSGTRVLLAENRGGLSTNGMGFDVTITNVFPVPYSGGPEAVTNLFDTGETSGTIVINADFYSLPDTMHVYYDNTLLFDSGLVSNTFTTNVSFGPGLSTVLTIVMNEGGNADSNTAWFYSVSSTRVQPLRLTFTENTNLAALPIKFGLPPLTNFTYSAAASAPPNGIYYLPEESLAKLAGESALGNWTLELWDNRAGAAVPQPALRSWQLALALRNSSPAPIPLVAGLPVTNTLAPGQVQWCFVDAPPWINFATNSLLNATAPVNLLFNQAAPPTGTNAGDILLLTNISAAARTLQTNGTPPLAPGARYFLGIQNTNPVSVTFACQVDFDIAGVITLSDGVPFANTNAGAGTAPDYYRLVVTTNAVRAQFEINLSTANLTLVARRGLPVPSLAGYDFLSANPGLNDELIVFYNYSTPVPLSPGEWYLAAINVSGVPAAYSILATTWTAYGTNTMITNAMDTGSSLCLTWPSLPGAHYYLQGLANLNDSNWITLTRTLTATDYQTTFCLPKPLAWQFFRVQEGLVLTFPPIALSDIQRTTNAVLLHWSTPNYSNLYFRVQWTPGLSPSTWQTFTNILTSTNGSFSFLDNGSQSGGLGQTRFYRLLQLP
ncbi:MAG TPA: S8 family serine peptidase [Candidatus Binatia bacterium]|nr:S8 family serine peptidase [Candidatus Binatia bacterium]